VQKLEIGVFWGILAIMFSQNGKFGKTLGKTFGNKNRRND
jgi:hypothetical protein